MTENKSAAFTPGPWSAEPMVPRADNAFYITATPDGNNSTKDVATVGPCLAKTTAANARLIAAAPELYEAVERALRHAQNIGVDSEGSSYVNQLRAALAKARGEQ